MIDPPTGGVPNVGPAERVAPSPLGRNPFPNGVVVRSVGAEMSPDHTTGGGVGKSPKHPRVDALIVLGLVGLFVSIIPYSAAIAGVVVSTIVLAIGLIGASRERR